MDVKLHDIGEGMTEGEVIHLFVKEGDTVKIDQPLVEVQTDKMTAELPSPTAGIVKHVFVQQGDVIEVGSTMMKIEQEDGSDGDVTADQPSPSTHQKTTRRMTISKVDRNQNQNEERAKAKGPHRVLAAPHTRRLARELGIDINDVEGTGPIGRITDSDILSFKEKGNRETAENQQTLETPLLNTANQDVEEIPFKGRRKAIAKKMTQSLYTIPHVTHFDEVDVTNLLEAKGQLKALDQRNQSALNVSMAAFFIKAISLSLKEFPIFNAKLDEENEVIRLEKSVHIGLATDTDEGLVVPVIKYADEKSLEEIHQEMKDLIEKAKNNKLTYSEMTGSTFTISNVGPLGSTAATPIINYPEVGLMAFHKTKKMPMVNEHDEIVIRSMMNVSMSFDHRVADGAKAVAFTNSVIQKLENPYAMLVKLK